MNLGNSSRDERRSRANSYLNCKNEVLCDVISYITLYRCTALWKIFKYDYKLWHSVRQYLARLYNLKISYSNLHVMATPNTTNERSTYRGIFTSMSVYLDLKEKQEINIFTLHQYPIFSMLVWILHSCNSRYWLAWVQIILMQKCSHLNIHGLNSGSKEIRKKMET